MSAAADAGTHLYPLITDLGLILITAGIAALVFKKIRQPIVLGYIVAGFLSGPHVDFFPSVSDINSVEIWAEIGVIFLLFSLGLEFSFKKLVKVGGTAGVTALTQIVFMLFVGYFAGKWLNWGFMNSVFLGVIVSVSSTTIIVKAFDELGVKAQRFAGNVIGSLVVQDLIAILMMVLLSTVAVTQQFSGTELMLSVLKLLFFLTIWFVAGIYFIPTLLKKTKHLFNDEMLLIVALALCLLMVILAANVGFSPALGAFIMGSIIAETTQAEHIEHLVKPVKDLFGAVFFVSVGMLINPVTLSNQAFAVVALSLIVIVGQSISSTVGALISGQPFKTAVQTGMSLSQIGEFSFIIATLGISLKVTSDFLYPIVVAVSALSTFTTPFMIRFSAPIAKLLHKLLPRRWTKIIERYSANAQSIRTVTTWQIVLRTFLLQVVIHTSIIVAGIVLSARFVLPLAKGTTWITILIALGTLTILSPFLYALSLRRIAVKEVQMLMKERKHRGPIIMMVLMRILLTFFLLGFLLENLFSGRIALIAFGILAVLYFLFPKKLNAQYYRIEKRFMDNLNDRETSKVNRRRSELTPWEGHLSTFEIAKESNLAGKTLLELQLRESMGINIAFIKRGDINIEIPAASERVFPGDEVCVIGTDAQVVQFREYLEHHEVEPPENTVQSEIVLRQFELLNEEFVGKSIRTSALREKTKGLVVGLERRGERILNPDSHLILEKNDVLWIVGSNKLLKSLLAK